MCDVVTFKKSEIKMWVNNSLFCGSFTQVEVYVSNVLVCGLLAQIFYVMFKCTEKSSDFRDKD